MDLRLITLRILFKDKRLKLDILEIHRKMAAHLNDQLMALKQIHMRNTIDNDAIFIDVEINFSLHGTQTNKYFIDF